MISPASKRAKKKWSLTPRGRYAHQKSAAQQRQVQWEFAFDTWWEVWQQSGHWEERGVNGYQMCRYGDEGPYSPSNVYIAHNTQNKRDAWDNGKTSPPPVGAKKGKKYGKKNSNHPGQSL